MLGEGDGKSSHVRAEIGVILILGGELPELIEAHVACTKDPEIAPKGGGRTMHLFVFGVDPDDLKVPFFVDLVIGDGGSRPFFGDVAHADVVTIKIHIGEPLAFNQIGLIEVEIIVDGRDERGVSEKIVGLPRKGILGKGIGRQEILRRLQRRGAEIGNPNHASGHGYVYTHAHIVQTLEFRDEVSVFHGEEDSRNTGEIQLS